MLIPSIIFSHCKDHEKSMILPLMGNQCKYLVMFLRSFYIYTYVPYISFFKAQRALKY